MNHVCFFITETADIMHYLPGEEMHCYALWEEGWMADAV